MTSIQVIWHKNPDTDCTLSAIIMADFLTMKWYQATPYIQWPLNKETEYLLETYHIKKPEIKTSLDADIEVCLVDHNEASQAPDNLSELNVTWLIDHHKMQFTSSSPLNIRVEPICSTASILYKMYREAGFEISTDIATMMLACIMSDSLLWKSPTTTQEDKDIADALQKISKIHDLEKFAMPMFEAKSDLWDMAILDVIQYDYKIFELSGKRCGVGTLETTNPAYGLGRKDEVLEWFKMLSSKQGLDFIMLSIVDILNERNTTIIWDDNIKTLEDMFWVKVKDNLADLWNKISRKKQLAPVAVEYFKNL